MDVTCNIHIQVTLSLVKNIQNHGTGGWVDLTAKDTVENAKKIPCPWQELNPDSPVIQSTAYSLN
jgi:hypothetical protein